MIRRVVERRGDHEHRSGGHESAGDESSDDLALRSGEGDGKAVWTCGGLLRKEGGGDGEDIETAVKSNSSARSCRRLTESDVSDGSRTGKDADSHVLATTELRDGFDDVVSSRDFENVGTHNGFGVSGNDNGWFGLVLGSGWATPGTPDDLYGSTIAGRGFGLVVGVRGGGGVFNGGLERMVRKWLVLVKLSEHIRSFSIWMLLYIFSFHCFVSLNLI